MRRCLAYSLHYTPDVLGEPQGEDHGRITDVRHLVPISDGVEDVIECSRGVVIGPEECQIVSAKEMSSRNI